MSSPTSAEASGSRARPRSCTEAPGSDGEAGGGEWGPSRAGEMDWLDAELALTAPSALPDTFHTQQSRSTSSGGAAPKDAMARLLELRRHLNEASRLNIEMQKATAEAVKHTRQAKEELEELRHSLAYATEMEAADQGTQVLHYAATPALPFYADLLSAVPFLGRQHEELVEFRRLTSSNPWLKRESERLKQVVLNACKRAASIRLLREGHADPFGKVETMGEEELALYSLPRAEEDEDDGDEDEEVNWGDVGLKLERSGEDCRTRWLMVDRPGLRNGEAWEEDEIIELYSIVETDRVSSAPLDWESIADRLGTGRLGIECLMTYARGETNPANRGVDYTLEEDLELVRLTRIWGHWWALIGERIGTARPIQNYQAHHHTNLRPGHTKTKRWNEKMDQQLYAVVEKELAQLPELPDEPEQADEAESSTAAAQRAQSEQRHSADEGGSGDEEPRLVDAFERTARRLDWKRIALSVPGQTPLACRRRWVTQERKAGPRREKQRLKEQKERHEKEAEKMLGVPWTEEVSGLHCVAKRRVLTRCALLDTGRQGGA